MNAVDVKWATVLLTSSWRGKIGRKGPWLGGGAFHARPGTRDLSHGQVGGRAVGKDVRRQARWTKISMKSLEKRIPMVQ